MGGDLLVSATVMRNNGRANLNGIDEADKMYLLNMCCQVGCGSNSLRINVMDDEAVV